MPTTTPAKPTAIEARIAAGQPHVIITGLDDPATIRVWAAGTVEEYRASCLRVLKATMKDMEGDDAGRAANIIIAKDGGKAARMVARLMRECGGIAIKRVEG